VTYSTVITGDVSCSITEIVAVVLRSNDCEHNQQSKSYELYVCHDYSIGELRKAMFT